MKNYIIFALFLIIIACDNDSESEPNTPEEVIIEDTIKSTICNDLGYDFDYTNVICQNEFCDTGICLIYQDIWKEIFLYNNNLSDDFFNEHITICKTGIHEWDEGLSFYIYYIVTHDWAKASRHDSFIIKIHEDNTLYPHVSIRRGVFLSKQEITIALYYNAFGSNISKISSNTNLKYNSIDLALSALIDSAKVDTLCAIDITIDKTSGNITLETVAEYTDEYNSCIYANIDLFSGNTDTENSLCFFEDYW